MLHSIVTFSDVLSRKLKKETRDNAARNNLLEISRDMKSK